MGPSGHFTHINVILDCLGQVCIWVELPVQRRLWPIFVRDVGSPDIHECFRGLTGSQQTPGIWGVTCCAHVFYEKLIVALSVLII